MVIKQNVLVYYSIYILYTEKEKLSQAVCQIKSSSDVNICVLVLIEVVVRHFGPQQHI